MRYLQNEPILEMLTVSLAATASHTTPQLTAVRQGTTASNRAAEAKAAQADNARHADM